MRMVKNSPMKQSIQRSITVFKLKDRKAEKWKPPQDERIDSIIGTGVLLTATTPELAGVTGKSTSYYVYACINVQTE